jgi:hypothetical protein
MEIHTSASAETLNEFKTNFVYKMEKKQTIQDITKQDDITEELLFEIFKEYDKQQDDFCDLYADGGWDDGIDGFDNISYCFKLFKLFEHPNFRSVKFMNFEKLIQLICEKIAVIPKNDKEDLVFFECSNISSTKWKNYDNLFNDSMIKGLQCDCYEDVNILTKDLDISEYIRSERPSPKELASLLYNALIDDATNFTMMGKKISCFQKHEFENTDLKTWNEVKYYIGIHVSDRDIPISKVMEYMEVFEKLYEQKRIYDIPIYIKQITTYNPMFYIT